MTPPFTHSNYRELLAAAKASGYTAHGFGELPQPNVPAPALLLRHDCDNDLVAAAAMAEIEAEAGVRSTYFLMLRSALYNLLALPNLRLARQIADRGHWIGLHFDEATVVEASADDVAVAVDRERVLLGTELGVDIAAVSFHQPTLRALDGTYRLNCVNTYDPGDMAGFAYLSESNTIWKEDPFEVLRTRHHPRLQMLIHPEWWTERPMTVTGKWRRMLEHNFELMQGSMLEREGAYTEPLVMSFRRGREGDRR
jgi:hypothetical protein